jgi:hypothetical protein
MRDSITHERGTFDEPETAMDEMNLLTLAAVIFGPTGAAYVGARTAFRGIYKRLDRHERKLDELGEGQTRTRERLAAVETKLEAQP